MKYNKTEGGNMKKDIIYKLYDCNGYKCRINTSELLFLFGVSESIQEPEQINIILANSGYYIKK